jgi:Fur family transcriptional regulator, ferric uptake regulator
VPHTFLPEGVRLTRSRRAVLAAIDATKGAFTVAEIHDRARRNHDGLGLATTYRTLELLRESGSLHALRSAGTPTYVRCHPEHHHHLVCLSCGSVEETELCAAPPAAELKRRYGFSPATHELEIYGTCRRCAA